MFDGIGFVNLQRFGAVRWPNVAPFDIRVGFHRRLKYGILPEVVEERELSIAS
jgi:hypothetical protein